MFRLIRRCGWWPSCLLVFALVLPAAASERSFPFDRELMLDVAPMPGSKRVPIIEIDANGAASIDLWCASLRGQASVGEDSISIVPGPSQPAQSRPTGRAATRTSWRRWLRSRTGNESAT
jgi:hypothetical protein